VASRAAHGQWHPGVRLTQRAASEPGGWAWQTLGMDDDLDALLDEQIAYYRARAPEYDEVYADKGTWGAFLDELPIAGDVLELACGSGWWTPLLARRARSVTAVDAAPEMLALARLRVRDLPVELLAADLFAWRPPRRYDTAFFAFWLSHIPPARFAAFWSTVGAALAPGGRACFLDTSDRVRDIEWVLRGQPAPSVRRRLRDGSEYRVVKTFYSPAELAARLAELGWTATIREVAVPILAGTAIPTGTGWSG
jgi:SAM-dependent methyltransferase